MKKILIVGSRFVGKKNNPQVIFDSLESDKISAKLVYWEDMVFDIKRNNVTVNIDGNNLLSDTFDLCIAMGWYKNGARLYYRDVALSFSKILKAHEIPFWNNEMSQQRSISKLSTMVMLALQDIPVPSTRFSINKQKLIDRSVFPYVAKAISASRGANNYLVNSSEDSNLVLNNEAPFLTQPYLENDHDLRVICFGGKPRLILKRSRATDSNTHLNNTSTGGNFEWLDLNDVPSELLTNTEKISKITRREMAGIDFIPDSSSSFGYSCLEVNSIPQLTSGADVEIKLSVLRKVLENS